MSWTPRHSLYAGWELGASIGIRTFLLASHIQYEAKSEGGGNFLPKCPRHKSKYFQSSDLAFFSGDQAPRDLRKRAIFAAHLTMHPPWWLFFCGPMEFSEISLDILKIRTFWKNMNFFEENQLNSGGEMILSSGPAPVGPG